MARVPLSGSASPRLSPGGVRVPSVGHMPFFLILVVALLFGLTPTAGASVARLGRVTRVRGSWSGPVPPMGSTTTFRSRARVLPTALASSSKMRAGGDPDPAPGRRPVAPRQRSGTTRDSLMSAAPPQTFGSSTSTLGDGNDVLTITDLVYPPGLLPREAFVIARGDAGNDTLIGGAGRDDFNGGAGPTRSMEATTMMRWRGRKRPSRDRRWTRLGRCRWAGHT